jgi:hypothetical protein
MDKYIFNSISFAGVFAFFIYLYTLFSKNNYSYIKREYKLLVWIFPFQM